jgi:hypothetical protein
MKQAAERGASAEFVPAHEQRAGVIRSATG